MARPSPIHICGSGIPGSIQNLWETRHNDITRGTGKTRIPYLKRKKKNRLVEKPEMRTHGDIIGYRYVNLEIVVFMRC